MRRPWVNKERLGRSVRRAAAPAHGSNSSRGDKNVHQTSAHTRSSTPPASFSSQPEKVRSLIWRLHGGAPCRTESGPANRGCLLVNVLDPALPSSATQSCVAARDGLGGREGGRFTGRDLAVETLKVSTDIRPLPSRFSVSTRVPLTLHKDGAMREAASISGRIG